MKGAGHDYLGRNCAPDSLLLWTQPMRGIQVHEAFLPQGAPAGTTAQQAITVQAGVRWLEVYEAATAAGRYVQGGGCTSVGACGNETDYFLKDAGQAQWGPHLARLQAIKRRVDPTNLFRVHNGIGNLKA